MELRPADGRPLRDMGRHGRAGLLSLVGVLRGGSPRGGSAPRRRGGAAGRHPPRTEEIGHG